MEENMNLDHGLQYDFMDFMDFMGVGAQHDDDDIKPVEHELDPEQENMNLDRRSQYSFIDFMSLGAQHGDDIDDPQELDRASENMNLDRGSPTSFMGIVVLSAEHGDDIDIDVDDLISQGDSTCSDVNDACLEDCRVYSPMELQLGPTLNPTMDPTMDAALDLTLDPVTAESWAVWADIVHQVLSFILMRILISIVYG